MHQESTASTGNVRSLIPGLAWVLGSVLLVAIAVTAESGIQRWVSPHFFGSFWDLILSLCMVLGAIVSAIVGLVKIFKAPVRWYWRVMAVLMTLLLAWWLFRGLGGMLM